MNIFKLFSCIFLMGTILGCSDDYIYEESQNIEDGIWYYSDIKSFEVDLQNIDLKYSLHLIIKHSQDYKYENIYMKIHTSFPTIEKKEEQVTINLADKMGDWVGQCSGNSCEVKVFLLEAFKIPEAGKYTFAFEQYTRVAGLEGVQDLHLQILESNED